jgi:pilus assembly protein Flp/PilA
MVKTVDQLTIAKGIAPMQQIRRTLIAMQADDRAVTALEYAMIASLIAVAVVTILTSLGSQVSSVLSTVSSAL